MKRLIIATLFCILVASTNEAEAQFTPTYNVYSGQNSLYGAPGFYGTSYGTASYGLMRTSSSFNSPYGPGYGYGYQTPGFIPNKYGVGLWRPGFQSPGYIYGAPTAYRTYPMSTWPIPKSYGPPIGSYAPGLGPSPFVPK